MPDASNREQRSTLHLEAPDAPTGDQIEKAFTALCRAAGKRSTGEIGEWRLERRFTPEYRIVEVGMAESPLLPHGGEWWTAGEFCKAAFFALRLLETSEDASHPEVIDR